MYFNFVAYNVLLELHAFPSRQQESSPDIHQKNLGTPLKVPNLGVAKVLVLTECPLTLTTENSLRKTEKTHHEIGRWNHSNLLPKPIRARRRPPSGGSAATSAVDEQRQRNAPFSH